MDTPEALSRHLASLTEALDMPGADLQAMLEVFIDDLSTAVPSFLGLRITTTTGDVNSTLNALDPRSVSTVRASLMLPLAAITGAGPVTNMTLYAAVPGAFNHLAIATGDAFDLAGRMLIDQHLPSATSHFNQHPVTTEDATMINMAIGVLIEQGYPPHAAHHELSRRAREKDSPLVDAARDALRSVTRGPEPGGESR